MFGLSLAGGDLFHHLTGQSVVGLLWLGLLQMGAAYLLFLRGLRTVTASMCPPSGPADWGSACLRPTALPLPIPTLSASLVEPRGSSVSMGVDSF